MNHKFHQKLNNYIVFLVFVCVLFISFFVSISSVHASSAIFCHAEKSLSTNELNTKWKALTAKEKKSWSEWAKKNPVLLNSGKMNNVGGQKAFGIILNSRLLAGETLNASLPPRAPKWFPGALSLRDAGPFTENMGYMGFRAERILTSPTKWFVCATSLMNENKKNVYKNFSYITNFSLGATDIYDLTPDFAPKYRSIFGSLNPPGGSGEWWSPEKFIWFQVYQYDDGQLAPGFLLKGRIQVEL